jgi:hypothetical protein
MTAPVECLDEREAFEAWVLTQPGGTEYAIRRRDMAGSERLGSYVEPAVEFAWQALCARSASRQEGDEVPEGCTPADARMLRVANHGLAAENDKLREALAFYAEGNHFIQHDPDAWDTVSGEPANFYEDESNTATVEDGSVAKMALDAVSAPHQAQEAQGDRHGE